MSHYIIEGGPFARAFEAMPREYLLPWVCGEASSKDGTKKPRTASKVKFTCTGCGANAWGRPALSLVCGECNVTMQPGGRHRRRRRAMRCMIALGPVGQRIVRSNA